MCNCSCCRQEEHRLAFATPDKFSVKTPRKDVSVYRFNKQIINQYFCRYFCANCAITTQGGVAPYGKHMVAINLRCLPDVDIDKRTSRNSTGRGFSQTLVPALLQCGIGKRREG